MPMNRVRSNNFTVLMYTIQVRGSDAAVLHTLMMKPMKDSWKLSKNKPVRKNPTRS